MESKRLTYGQIRAAAFGLPAIAPDEQDGSPMPARPTPASSTGDLLALAGSVAKRVLTGPSTQEAATSSQVSAPIHQARIAYPEQQPRPHPPSQRPIASSPPPASPQPVDPPEPAPTPSLIARIQDRLGHDMAFIRQEIAASKLTERTVAYILRLLPEGHAPPPPVVPARPPEREVRLEQSPPSIEPWRATLEPLFRPLCNPKHHDQAEFVRLLQTYVATRLSLIGEQDCPMFNRYDDRPTKWKELLPLINRFSGDLEELGQTLFAHCCDDNVPLIVDNLFNRCASSMEHMLPAAIRVRRAAEGDQDRHFQHELAQAFCQTSLGPQSLLPRCLASSREEELRRWYAYFSPRIRLALNDADPTTRDFVGGKCLAALMAETCVSIADQLLNPDRMESYFDQIYTILAGAGKRTEKAALPAPENLSPSIDGSITSLIHTISAHACKQPALAWLAGPFGVVSTIKRSLADVLIDDGAGLRINFAPVINPALKEIMAGSTSKTEKFARDTSRNPWLEGAGIYEGLTELEECMQLPSFPRALAYLIIEDLCNVLLPGKPQSG